MKSTFVSRYAGYFVLFLVIEQAIVASSTFWLAWLAKGIIDNGPLMLPFIGFTCSLTLVYIPSILKNTYLSKAKIRSLELYIDKIGRAHV